MWFSSDFGLGVPTRAGTEPGTAPYSLAGRSRRRHVPRQWLLREIRQARATQRKVPPASEFERRLVARILELACRFGRYGDRGITALLKREGRPVNHKRVERIWRRENLKVPKRQPNLGRLWLNDGSYVRVRPERPNHVWSYDFVFDRTHDGRPLRLLTGIDEYARECLAIDAGPR